MKLRSRAIAALLVTAGAVGLLAAQLASQAPPPAPLVVLSKDAGRRALSVTVLNDQEFVALDDLATLFQLAVREDTLGALTVNYKGRTVVLTPDQALASVAGRLVALPAPVSRAGRRWLVPVDFIGRALAPIYDAKLELRKPSRLVIVGDLRVPRIAVRYDLVAPGGRLTIDATPRATSVVTQDNERLTIKFDADALDVTSPPLPAQGPQSLVQAVRVIDALTLAVDLSPRNAGFRATSQPVDTTTRLTIDVAAPDASPAPAAIQAPPPAGVVPPAPPVATDVPALTAPASAVRTIAIDAGHGGIDEGVKGASGTKEKDITLAVARRLKAAVEARLGIRVLLTRDDDRDVAVDDRTAVANNNKADLFISLHVNASQRASTSGATIYYAAFDQKVDVLTGVTSRPERLPTVGGGTREIDLVAWDLAQTHHLDDSTAFAAVLEEQFRDRIPLAIHAVAHAPLAVLKSANMPAVLVEMGFLSNGAQEAALGGNDFQNAFVQAVSDAVVKFRDALGSPQR